LGDSGEKNNQGKKTIRFTKKKKENTEEVKKISVEKWGTAFGKKESRGREPAGKKKKTVERGAIEAGLMKKN